MFILFLPALDVYMWGRKLPSFISEVSFVVSRAFGGSLRRGEESGQEGVWFLFSLMLVCVCVSLLLSYVIITLCLKLILADST